MGYTPIDILQYILDNELDSSFLNSMLLNKYNFTIAEIADAKYLDKCDHLRLKSSVYDVNIPVYDEEIVAAVKNKLYVSTFIARKDSEYQIHFLVHKYLVSSKPEHEDEIAKEVVQYMILKTVISLRLDTIEKVTEYCK